VDLPVFYVLSFGVAFGVWPDEVSQWIRQRNSIRFSAKLQKKVTENLAMNRQAFGEESMSRTHKVQITETVKGETDVKQSQEHVHHFL
jgi:hypothetical protein